jgi:hypothetical protein
MLCLQRLMLHDGRQQCPVELRDAGGRSVRRRSGRARGVSDNLGNAFLVLDGHDRADRCVGGQHQDTCGSNQDHGARFMRGSRCGRNKLSGLLLAALILGRKSLANR